MEPTTRGVVLAGGDSVRFGDRDKALARVGGRPMLRRVADAVRTATGRPAVVAVADADRRDRYRPVLDDASFVFDARDRPGPLGGFAAAVGRVEADRLFVCGCDMPDLDPTAVEWLADRWESAEAVVPVADGVPQPLHAWYDRNAVAAVLNGDVDRLRTLIDLLHAEHVPVGVAPPDVPLATSLRNVNTRADLDGR